MSFSEDSDAPRTDFDVDDLIQDLETQSSLNNLASSVNSGPIAPQAPQVHRSSTLQDVIQ